MNKELREKLEDAADKYRMTNIKPDTLLSDIEAAFIAGAEWREGELNKLHNPAYITGFTDGMQIGSEDMLSKCKKWLEETGKLDYFDLVELDMEIEKLQRKENESAEQRIPPK